MEALKEAGSDEQKWVRTLVLSKGLTNVAAELFLDLEALLETDTSNDSDRAASERSRHALVIEHFARFVDRAWLEPGAKKISYYLLQMALAKEQLNDGVPHPLETPASKGSGRKHDRFDIWLVRVPVCLSVYCYEQAKNQNRKQIAEAIAKKNPGLKRLMRSGTEKEVTQGGRDRLGLSGAIRSWYRALTQGAAPQIALARWEDGKQLCHEQQISQHWNWSQIGDACLRAANANTGELIF